MSIKLKKSEQAVLDKVKELGDEVTPTQVGMALGYPHVRASSRVAPALKALTEAGLLVRRKITHNMVTYTPA